MMAFITQFNLAEVSHYDMEGALPIRRLLSFFYETEGEPLYAERRGLPEDAPYELDQARATPQSWRVTYNEADPATFIRHSSPPVVNARGHYAACATRFATEYTLPDVDGPELSALELGGAVRSALIDLDHLINRGTWEEDGHHLLGFPYNLGGPTVLECADAVQYSHTNWEHAGRDGRLEIERTVATRWRLLLQVSGSDITEMDWAGGGILHFCIERLALHDRNFSRVGLNMQFL